MSTDLAAAGLELEDRYPSDSLVALCVQRCGARVGASFRRVVSSQLPQHVLRKPLPLRVPDSISDSILVGYQSWAPCSTTA